MGCCGEPNKPNEDANRVSPYNSGTVNQQPGPHPGPQFNEKFQQPNIPSPTPSHPHGRNAMNSFSGHQRAPSNWSTHSPSPPPMNQYGTPGVNNTFSSSVNGIFQHQPLLSPTPTHNASHSSDTTSPHRSMSSPPVGTSSGRQEFKPPSDEGKMSVSIDFGRQMNFISVGLEPDIYQVQHSLAWWVFNVIKLLLLLKQIISGVRIFPNSCREYSADPALARIL